MSAPGPEVQTWWFRQRKPNTIYIIGTEVKISFSKPPAHRTSFVPSRHHRCLVKAEICLRESRTKRVFLAQLSFSAWQVENAASSIYIPHGRSRPALCTCGPCGLPSCRCTTPRTQVDRQAVMRASLKWCGQLVTSASGNEYKSCFTNYQY